MSKRKKTDAGMITVLTKEEYLRQQAANVVNLEMQNYTQKDWRERSMFYLCRNYVEGFRHGQPYGDMEPCLHIGILDFNLTASPGFHHEYHLRERKTGEIYSSKIGIHVIELRKITDGLPEDADEYEKELYRWSSIMAAENWEEMEEVAKGNPYMEAAEEEMRRISLDEKQRYLYLREEMAYIDRLSQLATAKSEGEKQGEARGEARGGDLKLISLIRKKCAKQKTLEVIADELEETAEVVCPIYEAIQASPELTDQEIYDRLFPKTKRY